MVLLNRRCLLAGAAALGASPSGAQFSPEDLVPRIVRIPENINPFEIYVLPERFYLLWTLPEARALRYIVGIGREERWRSGVFHVGRKAEWPGWTPTPAMIRRDPAKYAPYRNGIPGGPRSPLGARALYLHNANGGDTYLRIHGTPEGNTVGVRRSNGCVRMLNEHVTDLYNRVPIGTRVVLH